LFGIATNTLTHTNEQTFSLAPGDRERVAAKGHLLERSWPKTGCPHRDKDHAKFKSYCTLCLASL